MHHSKPVVALLICLASGWVGTLPGCGGNPRPPATNRQADSTTSEGPGYGGQGKTPPPALETAALGSTAPVHKAGNVYLAGQPSQEDLATFKARGIETVVSLREADELPWDEEAVVEGHDMQWVSIPFGGADELSDDIFDEVRKVLNNDSQPLVLHCGGAVRVGAVWMAHRVLDEGVDPETALAEAKQVGLRSSGLIERAQDYIRRKQAEGDSGVGAEYEED
jgi:protein tyrosine phosphatase (PTP) superfamily phosphohydrolase (DUF442 family)